MSNSNVRKFPARQNLQKVAVSQFRSCTAGQADATIPQILAKMPWLIETSGCLGLLRHPLMHRGHASFGHIAHFGGMGLQ